MTIVGRQSRVTWSLHSRLQDVEMLAYVRLELFRVPKRVTRIFPIYGQEKKQTGIVNDQLKSQAFLLVLTD